MMLELLQILVMMAVLLLLYCPRIYRSPTWSAAVTPLASIIGSGFLVSGPLLVGVFHEQAIVAMLVVVVSAYLLGDVVRFNIAYAEPLLSLKNKPDLSLGGALSIRLRKLERMSELSLTLAYVISVAFYIRLLAAFALKLVDIEDAFLANGLATLILMSIAAVGWFRNLRGLVFLEKHAVNGKLAIIACLLLVLGLHFSDLVPAQDVPELFHVAPAGPWSFANLRYLAGMLLIVQGFETARYLGQHFSAGVRIRSMRQAQLLSGLIYCLFIYWATDLFIHFNGETSETDIINVVGSLSLILPFLLSFAAMLSQFSAAIADTLGSGGLQAQLSEGRISERSAYVIVCLAGLGLIWMANIFSIITIASKVFAFYYLFQCLIAVIVGRSMGVSAAKTSLQLSVAAILLFVIVFALPVAV